VSGGSYDYLYSKIALLADAIEERSESYSDEMSAEQIKHRARFVRLLRLVCKAAYDIEWVDSGDCSPGDELPAIKAIEAFCRAEWEEP
jgi:hypothetical protein